MDLLHHSVAQITINLIYHIKKRYSRYNMALEYSEWLCDRDNIWLQPSSLILAALHISAYPRIHVCTDTAWSSQWQGREEMVLEGCQAGSSEWPYMVKSAVSRTERQKRQRQRRLSSIEVLETHASQSMGKDPGYCAHACILVVKRDESAA